MSDIKTDIINRELSWLKFNERVLEEAERTDNKIEERLRFLAITSANLDEFFSVRVARLKNNMSDTADCSGYTPRELEKLLLCRVREFYKRQYACAEKLLNELEDINIFVIRKHQLSEEQQIYVYDYYRQIIKPNLGKSGTIKLDLKDKIIDIPECVPRVCQIPCKSGNAYTLSEDIAAFGLMRENNGIKSCTPLRITRNEDFLVKDVGNISKEVKKVTDRRKSGNLVRIETETDTVYKSGDIYNVNGPIDLGFIEQLIDKRVKPYVSKYRGYDNLFERISKSDMLVYHPYDSFRYVIDFINSAADDKNVTEIKQTIYRLSENSPIADALCRAAENGKTVTVLIEMKARFDEDNNLRYAERLKDAGCRIVYGVGNLKAHCKLSAVVRSEKDGNKTYLHISTGNYNEVTAKGYTDIGLFTCRKEFTTDADRLFRRLEGYEENCVYKKFVISPYNMRGFIKNKIEREIENVKKGLKGKIFMKVNSLSDSEVIRLLYKASQYGVEVKLIVRGICCLIPQKQKLSENIEVFSIVGRFLEHSRIFRFENGGEPEVYIGSADMMRRNLDRRIEIIYPIEDYGIKDRIERQISNMLMDNRNLRIMNSSGSYTLKKTEGKIYNSQEEL